MNKLNKSSVRLVSIIKQIKEDLNNGKIFQCSWTGRQYG